LGAIFAYAAGQGRGRHAAGDGRRERRASDDEYTMFGRALLEATGAPIWPPAVAAARFLALTGWCSGEALGLRWDEVDLARRQRIWTGAGPFHRYWLPPPGVATACGSERS
jgi:integrase